MKPCTSRFSTAGTWHVIYVAKADCTHPVRMVSAVGRRLPAHCTAVGLMLLARLDARRLDELYPLGDTLPALTKRSITSAAQLRSRLAEIRAYGIAGEYCESNDAVACVAAPVTDRTGTTVAALSISVPIVRWTPERKDGLGRFVADGAAALSARLGHVG
jgi:IclR family transcriptional regulator, KDG regulon repressor